MFSPLDPPPDPPVEAVVAVAIVTEAELEPDFFLLLEDDFVVEVVVVEDACVPITVAGLATCGAASIGGRADGAVVVTVDGARVDTVGVGATEVATAVGIEMEAVGSATGGRADMVR